MVNPYILNPAAGGTEGDLEATISYRKQWVNFSGGPVTYYFTANTPIKVIRKPDKKAQNPFHSAGIVMYNDKTGPISKTTLMGSYGYNMPFWKDYRLAAGIFAGITEMRLNYDELKFDQEGESVQYPKYTIPDGSLGLWMYNQKVFFGASINQLFYNKIHFLKGEGNLVYHYYMTAGYNLPLGYKNSRGVTDYSLVPSVMLKYGGAGTDISVDLNLKLFLLNQFWLGTSYRHTDSQVFLAGYKWHSKDVGIFEVAYSYDLTFSRIRSYTYGSHEITLRYIYRIKELICPSKFW
jgi:type IX secretion system PorP/SprF family membrane protein